MISKEQVKHIATLARLKIDDSEAETYSAELSKVLGYIDQMSEVDTGGRQIDIDASGLVNRLRADQAVSWDEAEKKLALQQAEVVENNLIKVPRVL
jgi:aspartyl-tRNA(Asn)/glutamyl-tRNA(Gln) amidotransferase subunit C